MCQDLRVSFCWLSTPSAPCSFGSCSTVRACWSVIIAGDTLAKRTLKNAAAADDLSRLVYVEKQLSGCQGVLQGIRRVPRATPRAQSRARQAFGHARRPGPNLPARPARHFRRASPLHLQAFWVKPRLANPHLPRPEISSGLDKTFQFALQEPLNQAGRAYLY